MNENRNYSSYNFATIGRRVIATLLDQTIVIFFMFMIGYLTRSFPSDLEIYKVILFFSPILFYNPVMISLFGNTVFQKLLKVKIVREDGKYCSLHIAIFRWMIEIFFGWISIAYFFFNNKHQTLHDRAAGTLVYYVSDKNKKEKENFNHEETHSPVISEYPTAGRRLLFFFIWYIIISFIVEFILIIILLIAGVDIENETSAKYFAFLYFVIMIVVIILAAKGLLPGARRKKIVYIDEVES